MDIYKSLNINIGTVMKNPEMLKLVWLCAIIMPRTSFKQSMLYCLPECQGTPCLKQAPYLKFKWTQWDSNPQPLSS